MKTSRQTGLKQAVAEVLSSLGKENLLTEARIMMGWERIVGPQVAAKSFPCSLAGGVLTVAVFNSVWMTQLSFFREEMARKANGFLEGEAISSVRLVLRKKPDWWPPGKAGRPRKIQEPSAGDQKAAEESCREIADPELREIVSRVLALQSANRRS